MRASSKEVTSTCGSADSSQAKSLKKVSYEQEHRGTLNIVHLGKVVLIECLSHLLDQTYHFIHSSSVEGNYLQPKRSMSYIKD